MTTYIIRTRLFTEWNTDPQRRYYNGCHFSSETGWTTWVTHESGVPAEKVERRLAFWRELNDYAVSQRGEVGTKREFEALEEVHTPEELC